MHACILLLNVQCKHTYNILSSHKALINCTRRAMTRARAIMLLYNYTPGYATTVTVTMGRLPAHVYAVFAYRICVAAAAEQTTKTGTKCPPNSHRLQQIPLDLAIERIENIMHTQTLFAAPSTEWLPSEYPSAYKTTTTSGPAEPATKLGALEN